MAWKYTIAYRGKDPIEFVKLQDSWRKSEPEKKLSFCLKKFFNDPHIQKAVLQNDWAEVFKCWCEDWDNLHSKDPNKPFYGNKPGYQATTLGDFLAMSGIKFWEYFPTDVQTGVDFENKYCNGNDLFGLNWEDEE